MWRLKNISYTDNWSDTLDKLEGEWTLSLVDLPALGEDTEVQIWQHNTIYCLYAIGP
jgi:hypothetical protein